MIDNNFKEAIKKISLAAKQLGWNLVVLSETPYGSEDENAVVSGFMIISEASSFDPDLAAEMQDIMIDIMGQEDSVH